MKITIVTFLFICFTVYVHAQINDKMPLVDVESRTNAKIKYKVTDKFDINSQAQIRFNRISQYYEQYNFDLDFVYKLVYSLKFFVGAKYTSIHVNEYGDNFVEKHIRTNYGILYKFDIERYTLVAKIRYHDYFNMSHRQKYNKREQSCIRTYFELSYNIRNWKLDPIIFAEYFYRTSAELKRPKDKFVMDTRPPSNKYRLGVGTEYKLYKNNSLSLQYIYDCEIKTWNPSLTHIIEISYKYIF
ncbi:MAG TPA: DUF2490 domain-containing protein [Bacteroidales bacterium]|nr:DUF2490 domain-containing protein [Bacteroidales bacterium]